MRLPGREAQIQMLSERDRLFESDEHIDHAVLQYLKRTERDTELLARLHVFERHRVQLDHRTDGFGAECCDSAVAARLQRGHSLAFRSQQLAGWDLHVHQRDFGGAPTIDRLEALQVQVGRLPINYKEAHAAAIAWLARCPRPDDQLFPPWRAHHGGLGSVPNIDFTLAPSGQVNRLGEDLKRATP